MAENTPQPESLEIYDEAGIAPLATPSKWDRISTRLLNETNKTPDEIEEIRDRILTRMRDAGINEDKINETFGIVKPDNDDELRDMMKPAMEEAIKPPEGKEPTEEEWEDRLATAIRAGWQQSITGLASRGQLPTDYLPKDAEWYERIAAQAVTSAGDTPALLLGALMGAAGGAGTPASVPMGFGVSVGLTEGMRAGLMDGYARGQYKDFSDMMSHMGTIAIETAKGFTIGSLTGIAGQRAGKVVKGTVTRPIRAAAAEVTTMAITGAALNGEVPKPHHFTDAAIMIGGIHSMRYVSRNLMNRYIKTGEHPSKVAEDALFDQRLRFELLALPRSRKALIDLPEMPKGPSKNQLQRLILDDALKSAGDNPPFVEQWLRDVAKKEGMTPGEVDASLTAFRTVMAAEEGAPTKGNVTASSEYLRQNAETFLKLAKDIVNDADLQRSSGLTKKQALEMLQVAELKVAQKRLESRMRPTTFWENFSFEEAKRAGMYYVLDRKAIVNDKIGEQQYFLARTMSGNTGRADAILNFGPNTFKDPTKVTGKGLLEILRPVIDGKYNPKSLAGKIAIAATSGRRLREFDQYMASKRSIEMAKQGKDPVVPLAEAKTIVKEFDGIYEPIMREVNQFSNNVLEYLKDSGVVSKKDYDNMVAASDYYIPMKRLLTAKEKETRLSQGKQAVTKALQKQFGFTDGKLASPLKSLAENVRRYVDLAERNRLIQEVVAVDKDGDVLQKVPTKMKPIKFDLDEVKQQMLDEGIQLSDADAARLMVFRPMRKMVGDNDVILYKNGKPIVYRTDKRLAAALKGSDDGNPRFMEHKALAAIVKLLGAPTRALRTGITASPPFVLANATRDAFVTAIQTKNGLKFVADYYHGIMKQVLKDQDYQDYLRSGAANSSVNAMNKRYISRGVLDAVERHGVVSQGLNLVRKPIDVMESISQIVETAPRLQEFSRARAKGKNLRTSAIDAREVSVDFDRAGVAMQAINMISAFSNVGVQGLDRTRRSLMENPKKFLMTTGAMVTTTSIALWWFTKDDIRVQEAPDWQKDFYWLIPIDNWEPATQEQFDLMHPQLRRQDDKGNRYINNGVLMRVPKPFEIGLIFGSVPVRIADAIYREKGAEAFDGMFDSLWAATPSLMPQAGQLMWELSRNKSSFTGAQIIPEGATEELSELKIKPYTSKTAELVAGAIAMLPGVGDFADVSSPAFVDYAVKAWTGTLGAYVLDASDALLRESKKAAIKAGVMEDDGEVEPAFSGMSEWPVIKSFTARFPSAQSKSIQKVYDRLKVMDAWFSSIRKKAQSARTKADAREVYETIGRAADAGQFGDVRGALQGYRDAWTTISNIHQSDEEPVRKRQLIDHAYYKLIEQARHDNDVLDKVEDYLKNEFDIKMPDEIKEAGR